MPVHLLEPKLIEHLQATWDESTLGPIQQVETLRLLSKQSYGDSNDFEPRSSRKRNLKAFDEYLWILIFGAAAFGICWVLYKYVNHLDTTSALLDKETEKFKALGASITAIAAVFSLIWTADSARKKARQDMKQAASDLVRRWDDASLLPARRVARCIRALDRDSKHRLVVLVVAHRRGETASRSSSEEHFRTESDEVRGVAKDLAEIEESLVMIFNFFEEVVHSISLGYADEYFLERYFGGLFLMTMENFSHWRSASSTQHAADQLSYLIELYRRWGGRSESVISQLDSQVQEGKQAPAKLQAVKRTGKIP